VSGAGHGNVIETGGPELLERLALFLDQAADRTVVQEVSGRA
jgi:hypothetical protein